MSYPETDTSNDDDPGRRSPGLAIVAIAALAVAAWGLAGGPTLPDPSALGWAAVALGLVIGLVLVVTGAHSRG